ncbi:MAG: alpha/beta hydrolase [Chloroflexi bacterium]|nr:alpha/beta hydrolase [Chloroflexota bacterium]
MSLPASNGRNKPSGSDWEIAFSWEDATFRVSDGTDIYWQAWKPAARRVKAVVAFAHGLGGHSGRFAALGEHLASNGYVMLAMDLRGHGRSNGRRGYVRRYISALSDFRYLVWIAKNAYPGKAVIAAGHNMGGNLALNLPLSYPGLADGVFVAAPWLRLAKSSSSLVNSATAAISSVMPAFTISSGLNPDFIARDSTVIEQYRSDPLVHNRVSASLLVELSKAADHILNNADQINRPLLIMHGAADAVLDPSGSHQLCAAAQTQRSTCYTYDDVFHDVLNDAGHEQAYQHLLDWLYSIT